MSEFLETAWRIGAQLCRDAIRDGDRCNWLGDSMEIALGEWQVVHRSFGPDLYGGTSGIGLFLAQLNRFRRDEIVEATARGAMRQALSRIEDVVPEGRPSFYSGWLGIAWALLEVAELLDEPKWRKEAIRIVESQEGHELDPYAADVLGGAAGTATALVALYRRTKHERFLKEAIRLGEMLLKTANRNGDTMSWTTSPPQSGFQERDLTGYSHGAAGIALTLLELAAITGRTDFREAAFAGFRYERQWYSPQHQNWPDFRLDPTLPQQKTQPSFGLSWCHGAPGIGLSRLRAYQLTNDPELLAEADAAIQGTYRPLNVPSQFDNYSLCHGLGGNAEVFLLATRVLQNPQYKAIADAIGMRGMQKAGDGWPCGVNSGGEAPNLMLGIAGIGYFYLRLHDPEAVPSVLLV
jgi:type 2 lantibiotic biosynthesis protein LanM